MSSARNTVYVCTATDDDFETLKLNLREQDQVELLAYSGPSYRIVDDVIDRTRRNTADPYAFLNRRGELVALYGVGATTRPDAGIVWFLGTSLVAAHGQSLAAASFLEIDRLMGRRRMLYNYVYSANHSVHAWMRYLGFSEVATFPRMGHFGEGFTLHCRFASRRDERIFSRWSSRNPDRLERLSRNWQTLIFEPRGDGSPAVTRGR